MEFTVQQSDFARELKFAERVAEKRSTVPVLANVLLVARGDRVYLTATDLELGIQCSCPANVSSEGAATVPLRRLLDYVRLLPGGEVKVKFGENARASVTCGRSGARIAGLAAESYPELPKMPDASTDLRVDALSSMIAKTAFAISATESRFTLNGALFQIKDGSTSMIATDGHRLALTETVEPPPANGEGAPNRTPCRAVVPRKAIRELLNLMTEGDGGKTVAFAEDENHLFFRFGLRLLITRKLAGTFPDCERVLSADHNLAVIVEREALRSAIERVAQFADERSHSVRVHFGAGEVSVLSSTSEAGESEESVSVDYAGEPLDIGFNAQYLLEFLRAVPQPQVTLLFTDAGGMVEGRPCLSDDDATGETYRYAVMPLRLN